MSLIIHRCTECGDPDFWHRDHQSSEPTVCDGLMCGSHRFTGGPSELLPTYSDSGPVTSIVTPGSTWRGFGQKPVHACGCEKCKALHAEARGAA